jgi:predicted phage terminase large subunit-like protein
MGGGMIKKNWFTSITLAEFYQLPNSRNAQFTLFIDGAYTDKTQNDPSAFLVSCSLNGNLYIFYCESLWLEFPELVEKIKLVSKEHLNNSGIIKIEPKASGLSIIQVIKRDTKLNVAEFRFPQDSGLSMQSSKIEKVSSITTFLESGRCILIKGGWNDNFINECAVFPNGKNDDKVDTLCFAASELQFAREKRYIKYTN